METHYRRISRFVSPRQPHESAFPSVPREAHLSRCSFQRRPPRHDCPFLSRRARTRDSAKRLARQTLCVRRTLSALLSTTSATIAGGGRRRGENTGCCKRVGNRGVMRRSALSPDSYTNLFQNRREQSCLKKAQGRANQEILAKLYTICGKRGILALKEEWF
jgi:hypothetical protein